VTTTGSGQVWPGRGHRPVRAGRAGWATPEEPLSAPGHRGGDRRRGARTSQRRGRLLGGSSERRAAHAGSVGLGCPRGLRAGPAPSAAVVV